MISSTQFQEAGYKAFKAPFKDSASTYLRSYQKRVTDQDGVKYFITIHHYSAFQRIPEALMADAQLNSIDNSKGEKNTINLEMFVRENTTIADIERFYEMTWNNLNCDYYERRT